MTHFDLLYFQDKTIRMKKERIKEMNEKMEYENCSFKPTTTPYNLGKKYEATGEMTTVKFNQEIGI